MKEKFTFWVPIACVILLAAILVIQFKQQNHLNVLERQSSEIANTVQQQTAVMHRALGKIIPVELPGLLTNRISDMEKKISNEKAWPNDITESDAMRNELRNVLHQIPPWAEESILPRLNAMRWGIAALALIAKSRVVSDDTLGELFDEIDTALAAKPDGTPESVVKRLAGIQISIKERFDQYRHKVTIADAEKLVKKSGATPAEFSEVMEKLSEWSGEEGVRKLLHDIRSRMLSDETSDFLKAIESNLALADKELSVIIRQISRSRLLDSVISRRQSIRESHDADEKLIQLLTDQASRIEKVIYEGEKSQTAENEKKMREYQRWALEQIKKFNSEMNSAEGRRLTKYYDKNDYQKIKDAMVIHLVPVSVGLLDSAVSRLYSEAFERGWKKSGKCKRLPDSSGRARSVDTKEETLIVMRRVIFALHAGVAFAILLHAGISSAAGLMTAREQGALLWEAGISGEQVRPPQSQFIDDLEKTVRGANPGRDFESLRHPVSESAIRNFRIRQGFKGIFLSQYEAQAAIDYSQSLLRESPGKTLADKIKVLPSQQRKPFHGNVAEYAEARSRGAVLTKSRTSSIHDLTEQKFSPQNYQIKIYAQHDMAISSILEDLEKKYDFNKKGILPKATLEYGVKSGLLIRKGNYYQPTGRPDVTLEPSKVFSRPAESHLYAKTGRNVLIEHGSPSNAVPNTVKWLGRAGVVTLLATEAYIIHRFATGQMSDREFTTTQGVIVVGGLGAWGGALAGAYYGTPFGPYGRIVGAVAGAIVGSIAGAEISTRVASGYYGRLDTEQKREVDRFIFKHYGVNP